jgi:hypothetical protein
MNNINFTYYRINVEIAFMRFAFFTAEKINKLYLQDYGPCSSAVVTNLLPFPGLKCVILDMWMLYAKDGKNKEHFSKMGPRMATRKFSCKNDIFEETSLITTYSVNDLQIFTRLGLLKLHSQGG